MSTRRGGSRRHVEEHEEAENSERWAVSYADMMTVLLGLFIVLYAMSQMDQAKFEQLRESLAVGFGGQVPSVLDGTSGTLGGVAATQITPDLPGETGGQYPPVVTSSDGSTAGSAAGTTANSAANSTAGSDGVLNESEANVAAATVEYRRLEGVAQQVTQALQAQGLGDRVQLRVTDRGLIIGMVANDIFFTAASAQLSETAMRVIDTITPILVGLPDEVSVEGHANTLPVSGRYATNWELSADRATQVLRRMVEVGGLPGARVSAVGFGDARPLEDPTVDPLEANRRVDVVVVSSAPDVVRALLPSIAETGE